MNLSKLFDKGISTGVGGALLVVCLAVIGCERTAKEPDPALVNRALVWGEMRGRDVAFFAQEMTMLHPNSQRSQAARRTRMELDDVLRGKTVVDEDEVE